MTIKSSDQSIHDAINFYNDGYSLKQCGVAVGVSEGTLRKRFKELGVLMRRTSQGKQPHNTIKDLPEMHIIDEYNNGSSENAISKKYKVSRNVIRRILVKYNVNIRNQSESERLKWSQMSSNDRASQVKCAHDAVRGHKRSDEAKRNLALSREANTPNWFIGCGEPEFKEWLDLEGIEYSYQKAVEFYNVDFLINGIAIELTSFVGRNRLTREDFMCRAKILRDQGIKTLAVEFRSEKELLSHAYDVINMANKMRSNHYDSYYIAYRLQFNNPDIRILA